MILICSSNIIDFLLIPVLLFITKCVGKYALPNFVVIGATIVVVLNLLPVLF